MKKPNIDWRYLRPSLLWSAVFITVSVVPFAISWHNYQGWVHTHQKNALSLQKNQHQLREMNRSKKIFIDYKRRFKIYHGKGIIGKTDRLALMETVKNTAKTMQLPGLRLEILPQQAQNPDIDVALNGINIYTTPMNVEIKTWHEGDAFDLLDRLNTNAKGLFSTKQCTWARTRRKVVIDRRKTNFRARCQLHWYTLSSADLHTGAVR